ncbi:MAG: fibronectin type III domain-containing protein [Terriglobales bacterium]
MKMFRIAALLLLCASFAAAQTPATTQTATANQAGSTQVTKPMLEFANANSAKVAWTSKAGQDLVLQYSTDPNNFNQAADAIEHSGGDNHRATITNLQPNTTYYVRMTDKQGQPVGSVFTFKTPAQGAAPIHEQPLQSK